MNAAIKEKATPYDAVNNPADFADKLLCTYACKKKFGKYNC